MDPITALHNAARHFCIRGSDEWEKRYAALRAAGDDRDIMRTGEWTYTSKAYDIFPRYVQLSAILAEVERFVPRDFTSLEQCREFLAACGEPGKGRFDVTPNPLELAAHEAERRRFIEYIRTSEIDSWRALTPLPFRRVLGDAEHRDLMTKFIAAWGNWNGGAVDNPPAKPHITLHTRAMETPDAYPSLAQAIAQHAHGRLLELREWGTAYELDLVCASFTYNGAEGFWTQPDISWMAQASHESSITFGGEWLLQAMKAALPEFDRYIYRGWDDTLYA